VSQDQKFGSLGLTLGLKALKVMRVLDTQKPLTKRLTSGRSYQVTSLEGQLGQSSDSQTPMEA
jgi:hypothetical protein